MNREEIKEEFLGPIEVEKKGCLLRGYPQAGCICLTNVTEKGGLYARQATHRNRVLAECEKVPSTAEATLSEGGLFLA